MLPYCNYHMHTVLCDGFDTPEDMVVAALRAKSPEIGFSGHSYLPFDPEWTMDPETTVSYRRIIRELQKRYADRISIRLGIEQDYCSDPSDLSVYDYVIGGVHCVFQGDHYISVDLSAEAQREGIQTYYGGDPYAFVEAYYTSVGDLYRRTRCTIVAHFDLVTKFVEKDPWIDPENPRYRKASDRALEQLLEEPVAFELNTGAISRRYRTEPYPDRRILRTLGQAQAPVILSSDAHRAEDLFFGFDDAMRLVDEYDLNLFTDLSSLQDALPH